MTPAGNLTSCRPFQACQSPCGFGVLGFCPTYIAARQRVEGDKETPLLGGHYQEVTRSSSVHIMLPRSWLQRILGNVVFSGVTTHSIVNPSYIKQRKNGCRGTFPTEECGKASKERTIVLVRSLGLWRECWWWKTNNISSAQPLFSAKDWTQGHTLGKQSHWTTA